MRRTSVVLRLSVGLILLFVHCLAGPHPGSAQDDFLQGDADLAYWVVDGAAERTIIVVHGGPGVPHDYLRPELDRLARFGRVVFYDQRGCGASSRGDTITWRRHRDDLHRVVGQFSAGEPVVLVGSSWGVHLSLFYALEHPERTAAVVLSGAVEWHTIHPDPLRRSQDPEAWKRFESKRDWLAACMRGLEPVTRAEQVALSYGVDTLFAQRLSWEAQCLGTMKEHQLSLRDIPTLKELARVEVPALIIRGGRPYFMSDGSHELAETLPHADVVTIDEGGHDPWYNAPDEFVEEVGRFLRKAPGTE